MAEYSALAPQTVNPGASIVFTNAPVPCTKGFISHRDESSIFLLSGMGNYRYNGCRCRRPSAVYMVDFGAVVSIPDGGTVAPISISMGLDGNELPDSEMVVTPAAAGDEFSISKAVNVAVWYGCCQTFSITNTGEQPIQVRAANVNFGAPTLAIV